MVPRQLFADILAPASAACASIIGTETRIGLQTTGEVCRVVTTEAVTGAPLASWGGSHASDPAKVLREP